MEFTTRLRFPHQMEDLFKVYTNQGHIQRKLEHAGFIDIKFLEFTKDTDHCSFVFEYYYETVLPAFMKKMFKNKYHFSCSQEWIKTEQGEIQGSSYVRCDELKRMDFGVQVKFYFDPQSGGQATDVEIGTEISLKFPLIAKQIKDFMVKIANEKLVLEKEFILQDIPHVLSQAA